jgi:hypothetical protein
MHTDDLSALSAWWIKLGITPELTEPSSPQQNGQLERMHRTLKVEATKPAQATLRVQQRCFDAFRHEYNTERPHEALGNATPTEHYAPSPRPYPRRLADPEYPGHFQVRDVSRNGGRAVAQPVGERQPRARRGVRGARGGRQRRLVGVLRARAAGPTGVPRGARTP